MRVSLTADEVVILEATVLKMLHEDLGMNKVSAHVGFRNCLIPNKNCVCTFAKKIWELCLTTKSFFRKL
jgi:hypothetical protein